MKEAKHAAPRGEMSVVYKITKQLCGKNNNHSIPEKDRNENNLTMEHEQAT